MIFGNIILLNSSKFVKLLDRVCYFSRCCYLHLPIQAPTLLQSNIALRPKYFCICI